MSSAILTRLKELKIGRLQPTSSFSVLPILGPSLAESRYSVLDSGTSSLVKVSEVGTDGSVPVLRVENGLAEELFLMDGEELLGAKQNRILNTDVLVAAGSGLKVPVSCVEAGRWHYTSAQFMPGKAASHAVRAGKHARVARSLRERGSHDADQAAVWSEVQESLTLSNTASPTAALHDAYEHQRSELERVRAGLVLPVDAVGLAVFHGLELLGLDLFDRHRTLAHYWRSLIDSYAVDWLRRDSAQASGSELETQVSRILGTAGNAVWSNHPSPGLGVDYRLEDDEFTGSALVYRDSAPIHLTLFPRRDRDQASDTSSQVAGRPRVHRRRRI